MIHSCYLYVFLMLVFKRFCLKNKDYNVFLVLLCVCESYVCILWFNTFCSADDPLQLVHESMVIMLPIMRTIIDDTVVYCCLCVCFYVLLCVVHHCAFSQVLLRFPITTMI